MATDEKFYRFDRDFDIMRFIIRLIEKKHPIYERENIDKKMQLIRDQEYAVREKMDEIRDARFFDAGDLFISAKVLPEKAKNKGEEYRVVLALPAKRKFAKKLADLGVEVTYRDYKGDDIIYWSVKAAYEATHQVK